MWDGLDRDLAAVQTRPVTAMRTHVILTESSRDANRMRSQLPPVEK